MNNHLTWKRPRQVMQQLLRPAQVKSIAGLTDLKSGSFKVQPLFSG